MDRRLLTWLPMIALAVLAAGAGAWLATRPARPTLEIAACGESKPPEPERSQTPGPGTPAVKPETFKARPAAESGPDNGPQNGAAGEDPRANPAGPDKPENLPPPGGDKPATEGEGPANGKSPVASPEGPLPKLEQPKDYGMLKAALEGAQWDEHWRARGFSAPDAVSTSISGKILSHATRKGVKGATVGLLTFFPEYQHPVAPLLPLITEFTTDENGVFAGTLSTPCLQPRSGERLGLYVSLDGVRRITGQVVDTLVPGVKNELGIFWIDGSNDLNVHCDVRAFEGERKVVFTGELDPRRWHADLRLSTLAAFASADVGEDGFVVERMPAADVRPMHGSLLIGGQYRQTRSGMAAWRRKTAGSSASVFSCNIVFSPSEGLVAGRVMDGQGAGLAGAVLALEVQGVLPVAADHNGWFRFDDLPDFKPARLKCEHPGYLSVYVYNVAKDGPSLQVVMRDPKQRFSLRVTDRDTTLPLSPFTLRVQYDQLETSPWRPKVYAPLEINNEDGCYVLSSEMRILSFTVERVGYLPRVFKDASAVKPGPTGHIEVALAPGRKLEVRPRDYTAVNAADKWFADPVTDGVEGPGIWTAWQDQWIEWEIDFGLAPSAGEAGGFFELLLGCTNKGIVDNDYAFDVDVFVDGDSRGRVRIKADSAIEHTGRLKLGALSGRHRVRLVWRNDHYIEGQLDANIRYSSVRFAELAE